MVVAVVLGSAGAFDRLENDTVDARFSLRQTETPDDIVVVAIDDETIDRLRGWPISRRRHARAVERADAAGARLIVYDVQFTEPSDDPGADLALYDAIGRAGGAVLATSTSDDRGRTEVLGGDESLAAIDSRAGSANLPAEEGGVIRHYEPATGRLAALAMVAAQRVDPAAAARAEFPEGHAWIDFRGGPGTFRTVQFLDLIEGRVPRSLLQDKIVVIGASAPTLQDLHPTPTSGSRLMSGPEIQANAIWTALRGNPLRDAAGWAGTLAAALLAMLAPLAMVRRRFLLTVVIATVLGAVHVVASHLLFSRGIVVDVVMPLTALLASTAAAITGGAVVEARERRRVARKNDRLREELNEAYLEIVRRLAIAAESHDDQTGGHIERISELTHRLALAVGVAEHEAEMIRHASLMHDVGKIATPDAVLQKPGKLTDAEWVVMRRHTTEGARILTGSRSRLVQMAEEIALTHHERWDGSGYPRRLQGQDIPLVGRITAVCDVFDALISKRHYKEAWTLQDALAEIARQAGRQFDPRLVEAFLALVPELPASLIGGHPGADQILRETALRGGDVASVEQAGEQRGREVHERAVDGRGQGELLVEQHGDGDRQRPVVDA